MQEALSPLGYNFSILNRDACFELEPALHNVVPSRRDGIVGAIFQENECIADPLEFSEGKRCAVRNGSLTCAY